MSTAISVLTLLLVGWVIVWGYRQQRAEEREWQELRDREAMLDALRRIGDEP